MNSGLDRWSGLLAAYGMATVVAMTALFQTGRAQETLPCPPPSCVLPAFVTEHPVDCPVAIAPDHLHRVVINDKGQVTVFITKLPALGDVLKQTCHGQTCCEELVQTLGGDFHLDVTK